MGSDLYIKRNNQASPAKRYSLVLRTFEYETEYDSLFYFDYKMAEKLHLGGIPYKDGSNPTWEEIERDRLLVEKEELDKKLKEINLKLGIK